MISARPDPVGKIARCSTQLDCDRGIAFDWWRSWSPLVFAYQRDRVFDSVTNAMRDTQKAFKFAIASPPKRVRGLVFARLLGDLKSHTRELVVW